MVAHIRSFADSLRSFPYCNPRQLALRRLCCQPCCTVLVEMPVELDLWHLAAGLGLFLFGMHQLEKALQQLAGRSFKVFLREHTSRPVNGVFAGLLTTVALQSSTVVSLLVLALVGTGIVSLSSAIAIVLGANLGSTATGWIVASLGFKLDIENCRCY